MIRMSSEAFRPEITNSLAMREALLAEARGDASEALDKFTSALGEEKEEEAMESDVGRWERKLARRGAMDAQMLLGKWDKLLVLDASAHGKGVYW